MPVAHASTAVTGEKTGFFAALCTANGVLLAPENQISNQNNESQESQINSNTACPLCLLIEQGLYDSTALHTGSTKAFSFSQQFIRHTNPLFVDEFFPQHQSIRAPPAIS